MESQAKNSKILYIITQGFWGGAQRYVFDLATQSPAQTNVIVAIGEPKGSEDLQNKLYQSTNKHVTIYQLQHLVRSVKPIEDLRAIFEIRALIKREHPDTIHLNSSKAGIIGSLATIGLAYKPKVIYTVHGWVFLEPLPRFTRTMYKFLERYTASFKDQIIVLSETEKKIGLNLGIVESKLSVKPLSIPTPQFISREVAQAQLKNLSDLARIPEHWIGTIANLFPTKGLDILITAVPKILKTKPNTHFFIIGSGPQEKQLRKLIIDLNLQDQVHLLGTIPNAAEMLTAFDLFVLSSRKEGMPYTILEAMKAQLPIVATDVGAIREMTKSYSKIKIIPPEKPQELAVAILGFISSPK